MSEQAINKLLDEIEKDEFDRAQERLAQIDDKELYVGNKLPVDVVEFVESSEYLGSSVTIEPQVLQLLWLIQQPDVQEIFIEVGKGSGKSMVGAVSPLYGNYKLLCMRRPQLFFGLTSATTIATINVSIGQVQAKEVIFGQIKALVAQSPWFKKVGFDPLTVEIRFPKNIQLYCGHSSANAWLGFATLYGVLDEVNYMVNTANRNVADQLFAALTGSMKTRFPKHYKAIAISSCTTPGAWLHTQVEAAQRAGNRVQLHPEGMLSGAVDRSGQDNEDPLAGFDPFEGMDV